ncbi:Kinase suppressor of Ras 1 [Armadillidium vulgare]|nr:Kinase suppressor of Ras 1 [Armadillidium vulgare]
MSWGRGCGRSHGPAVLLGSEGSLYSQRVLEEPDVIQAIETCNTNCQLISSQAEHLQRMRSRCATSAQLTQQEIRNVEEKLVKLFSMQLVTKQKLPQGTPIPPELQIYPSLRQWLEVVGLKKEVVEGLCSELSSLENLLEKDDNELTTLLCKYGSNTLDIGKLIRSVGNLKKYTESHLQGKEEEFSGSLYWDSWEQSGSTSSSSFSSLSRTSHRAQRSSVSSSEGECGSGVGGEGGTVSGLNGSYASSGIGLSQRSSDDSNPSSPPLALPLIPPPPSPGGVGSVLNNSNLTLPQIGGTFQDRRYTPPPTPPIIIKSNKSDTLNVPKFARPIMNLSGSMGHNVHHRFSIALKPDKCGYCHQKFHLKCKECNFKCHKECEPKIAPSCGLPRELLQIFTESYNRDLEQQSVKIGSTVIHGYSQLNDSLSKVGISSSQPAINSIPNFLTQDSSSNTSSCNSSTPSSPALIIPHSPVHKSSFTYADPTIRKIHQQSDIPVDMRPWVNYEPKPPPPPISTSMHSNVIDSRQSHDSDRTVSTTSGSGSTGTDDSERTVAGRVDSQDSTVSEGETNDSRCTRQNSVSSVSQSLREWDIPYDDLVHGEIIGKGRFGTVYSGNWHGQVAIKELHMDYVNDEKTLEAFKAEVSTFRKTRHENLVLFMGACMKPPRLAIVTSLCKGMTLYGHIHILKDKFTMFRTIPIAQQIAQGMGYLHARGIVHKDLKTKNIFLENGKVIITDFGLFNVTRLCCDSRRGNWLSIPPGWLCYLAPEIMRALKLNPKPDEGLPFTTYSDVYSFGTVWYELLVEILMACWSFRSDERRGFSALLQLLTRLPKKRLARSPSHPVQLSRSAESVF